MHYSLILLSGTSLQNVRLYYRKNIQHLLQGTCFYGDKDPMEKACLFVSRLLLLATTLLIFGSSSRSSLMASLLTVDADCRHRKCVVVCSCARLSDNAKSKARCKVMFSFSKMG